MVIELRCVSLDQNNGEVLAEVFTKISFTLGKVMGTVLSQTGFVL